ncbi:hypothetical protein [Bacillus infantis]|uniref:Uncharacterized protein n=1 Tax=Bacillus infantis TaxID=324767 RepID=A0A5D4R6S7_9BACI|nr:hypothetical protein [Bacillus infantis]TYS46320.1 hypothetical protein FZD51_17235 [Bacillus infantis]
MKTELDLLPIPFFILDIDGKLYSLLKQLKIDSPIASALSSLLTRTALKKYSACPRKKAEK